MAWFISVDTLPDRLIKILQRVAVLGRFDTLKYYTVLKYNCCVQKRISWLQPPTSCVIFSFKLNLSLLWTGSSRRITNRKKKSYEFSRCYRCLYKATDIGGRI